MLGEGCGGLRGEVQARGEDGTKAGGRAEGDDGGDVHLVVGGYECVGCLALCGGHVWVLGWRQG